MINPNLFHTFATKIKNQQIMKRIIITLIVALITLNVSARKKNNDIIVKQSKGSITFIVDKGLSKPTYHLKDSGYQHRLWPDERVVHSSFDSTKVINMGSASMINTLITAYCEHRPLELSPDDIWLCISQGLARHVTQNAEALRDKFVYHKDKMFLGVTDETPLFLSNEDVEKGRVNPKVDWVGMFDQFVAMLKKNTKGDIVDIMCADFSTTTVESRIASQITLMNSMKEYFLYGRVSVCGIPQITLKGTPKDWRDILERARKLEQYDLKWWTDKLCPVLEEFVAASEGHPNRRFWQDIVQKHTYPYFGRTGCGGGYTLSTYRKFDGWFLTLFPYTDKGRMPSKKIMLGELERQLSDLMIVDFLCVDGCRRIPMLLRAGFVGAVEDRKTYGLKPFIGWNVMKKCFYKTDEDKELKKWDEELSKLK